jgi:hypothetical protein
MKGKSGPTIGYDESTTMGLLADPGIEPVEKAPKISPIMVVFTEEKMMRKA